MTILSDLPTSANPVSSVTPLTEAEMLAKVEALNSNPEFELFEPEMEDGSAVRMSALVAWMSADATRELAVYRYDRVSPDGTVTSTEELVCHRPWPIETESFGYGLVELFNRAYAAGRAEASQRA